MGAEISFGLWLEMRRKSLDLTREELTRKIGSSTSASGKIESDERRPSRQFDKLLANALDILAMSVPYLSGLHTEISCP